MLGSADVVGDVLGDLMIAVIEGSLCAWEPCGEDTSGRRLETVDGFGMVDSKDIGLRVW